MIQFQTDQKADNETMIKYVKPVKQYGKIHFLYNTVLNEIIK